MNYIPLRAKSFYSLKLGLNSPQEIFERINSLDLPGCAITDHEVVTAHIKFLKAFKDSPRKPILGIEFSICDQDATVKTPDNKSHSILLFAKNTQGWKDLIELVSQSNNPKFYYKHSRLDLARTIPFLNRGNLIGVCGDQNSLLGAIILDEKGNRADLWKEKALDLAQKLNQELRGNFWLEVQLIGTNDRGKLVAECIREISTSTHIPCVGTTNSYYCTPEDAEDQRILLCSNKRTTLEEAKHGEFSNFFTCEDYKIPDYNEMLKYNTKEELENTLKLGENIGQYDILSPPILPEFNCPNNLNPDEYLRQLCRDGWKAKIAGKISPDMIQTYGDRVKEELSVLQSAGLSSYFLIVKDILDYVRENNGIISPGRGSCAGCLVAYLLGITGTDSIKYDLIFSRFYNQGRNVGSHVSMPDIDVDIPRHMRDGVLQYIKDKYGADHVGQMLTFQTMKGCNALKDVFRAYGNLSATEMNEITANVIEEHKISDELEKMRQDTGSSSILRWCLENLGDKFKNWCYINDEGVLEGSLSREFEQAIRLEGVKVAQSKHPAGIVITPDKIYKMCPIVLDKDGNELAGLEMDDMESVGGIKFDLLNVSMLTKCMAVVEDLETGSLSL